MDKDKKKKKKTRFKECNRERTKRELEMERREGTDTLETILSPWWDGHYAQPPSLLDMHFTRVTIHIFSFFFFFFYSHSLNTLTEFKTTSQKPFHHRDFDDELLKYHETPFLFFFMISSSLEIVFQDIEGSWWISLTNSTLVYENTMRCVLYVSTKIFKYKYVTNNTGIGIFGLMNQKRN